MNDLAQELVDQEIIPEARHMLLVNSFAWALNLADRGLIGPLLPLIIVYFHIPLALAGFIVSAFFIGYLSTAFSGLLSDRFGRKRVMVTSVAGFGILTGFTALSPVAWFLVGWRILVGLFEGAQYPTGSAWITESFPRERRGRAIGVWEMAANVGLVAGIATASIVGGAFGWQAPWLVLVIPTVAVAYWMHKTVREVPRSQTPGFKEVKDAGSMENGRYREIFKIRNVWVGFVLHGLSNFVLWGLAAWVPYYMIKVKHMDFTSAGLVSAVFTLGIAVGMYVSGWASDFLGRRLVISLGALIGIPMLFIFMATTNPWIALVSIFFTGFFGNGWLSSMLTLIGDSITPNLLGAAYGVVMVGAEIGAVLGPLVGGIVAQTIGLATGLRYYSLLYLAAGIIVWIAVDMRGGAVLRSGHKTVPRAN